MSAVATIVVTLGLFVGPRATQFQTVTLPDPLAAPACPTRAAVVRIEADPHVRALERHGWRVVMWDCREGAPA